MAGDLIIRPARPEDIPRMCELLADLFTLESAFAPDVEKQTRGLDMLIGDTSGGTLVLVAELGGCVVGMATVQTLASTAEGGRVGLVEDVIVGSGHRRGGIGTALLRVVEQWAIEHGLSRLQLLADSGNDPALDFYRNAGWLRTGMICLRKTA